MKLTKENKKKLYLTLPLILKNLSNCIDIHIEGSKESSFKNRHAISESKKKKKRKWLQSLSDIDNHLET